MCRNILRLGCCLIVLLFVAVGPAFGQAGVGGSIGGALGNGSNVAVGQTNLTANFLLTNANNAGLAEVISNITFNPSCKQQAAPGVACPPGQGDLGVFTISGTGTGSDACAGITFTFTGPDANGTYTVTPNVNLPAG